MLLKSVKKGKGHGEKTATQVMISNITQQNFAFD